MARPQYNKGAVARVLRDVDPCSLASRDAELRGLRWHDVDLEAGTVRVERQSQYVDGRLETVSTKSEASERTIPIGEAVVAVLRRHKARQNVERLRAGNLWADGEYVFTRTDGQPLTPTGRRDHWTRLRKRLGLSVRFHDLRHTAATHMFALGAPAKVIQDTLGHSAFRTTMDMCTHTLPDGMRANATAMDGLLLRVSGQD